MKKFLRSYLISLVLLGVSPLQAFNIRSWFRETYYRFMLVNSLYAGAQKVKNTEICKQLEADKEDLARQYYAYETPWLLNTFNNLILRKPMFTYAKAIYPKIVDELSKVQKYVTENFSTDIQNKLAPLTTDLLGLINTLHFVINDTNEERYKDSPSFKVQIERNIDNAITILNDYKSKISNIQASIPEPSGALKPEKAYEMVGTYRQNLEKVKVPLRERKEQIIKDIDKAINIINTERAQWVSTPERWYRNMQFSLFNTYILGSCRSTEAQ